MNLLIDACVREESRTRKLADHLIARLGEPATELRLMDCTFPAVDEAFLSRRDEALALGNLQNPMFALAHQFAAADNIIIAAPFWDLSFPASLKQYLEQINVVGITFRYTENGIPVGMCRAEHLYYVTTAGGDYFPPEFGYGYVEALAKNFYGIRNVSLIKAVGLDLVGADVEKILDEAKAEITNL